MAQVPGFSSHSPPSPPDHVPIIHLQPQEAVTPPRQSIPPPTASPSPAPPAPGSHDCTGCLEQKVHSYSPKCDTIWFPPRVPSPPFSKSPRPLPSLSAPKQSPITALLPPKLPSRATKHALPQSPTPLSSLLLPPPDSEGQRVPNIWYEENLGDMLLELVESGLYSDTSLLCSDGEVTAYFLLHIHLSIFFD